LTTTNSTIFVASPITIVKVKACSILSLDALFIQTFAIMAKLNYANFKVNEA